MWPGSHMPPSYLRHGSDMRTEVAGNRGHVRLYCRNACEVDSSSTSHASDVSCCRRRYIPIFRWSITGSTGGNVAGTSAAWNPSSETQGQLVGARESLNGRKNMARRKVKNGEKSPWGQCLTRPVPNGRGRSAFWLVPENFCVFQTNSRTSPYCLRPWENTRRNHLAAAHTFFHT